MPQHVRGCLVCTLYQNCQKSLRLEVAKCTRTPKLKGNDESKARLKIVQMHMTCAGPIPAAANTCAP